MKMYKEISIIIIIILVIFIGDFITQKYTKKNVESLTNELNELKQNIINNSSYNANEKTKIIQSKIDNVHHKLSYYLEHNEIEKIETTFTSCKSFVETEDYNEAICEVEKTIFLVNHLSDKYSFNLDNIF
ncbi:MAG TPA: hypothetical protein DEP51_06015 [Clostridiales bacterium]|nr:hypothetical protein [Clostridiales bacterium]